MNECFTNLYSNDPVLDVSFSPSERSDTDSPNCEGGFSSHLGGVLDSSLELHNLFNPVFPISYLCSVQLC